MKTHKGVMDNKIESFADLFVIVSRLWPPEIDVGGCTTGRPIWPLVKIVDELQEMSDRFEELVDASIWPFHQAVFQLAIEALEDGRSIVRPRQVSMDHFRANLEEALLDPSWKSARRMYNRLR